MLAGRRIGMLTLALALAGCPATPPGTPRKPDPSPSGTKVQAKKPSPPPAADGTLLEGRLVGKVRAPLELISDQGGSVVSNNGGSLISDQGGSFISKSKLLDQQVAVAGVVVRLLRATGEPVKDAEGRAMTATTDALGRYSFAAAPPPVALVVSVDLAGDRGSLQGVAVADAGDRRVVETDLASTLTTVYIQERYLSQVADKEAALGRLPADVLAKTREEAIAAAGDGAGQIPVPEKLTAANLVAAVETLRKGSTAFDGQLSIVRDLLIAAGQSDLGNGRPGTEVVMGDVVGLVAAPDGSLYINSRYDYRVWKLGTDGKVRTVLGSGVTDGPDDRLKDPTGLPGPEVEATWVVGMALDALGRLIVAESPSNLGSAEHGWEQDDDFARTYRLNADGKVQALWLPAPGSNQWPRIVAADAGGDVHVITAYGEGRRFDSAHWVIAADGSRKQLRAFSAADSALLARTEAWGRDAAGRFYLALYDQEKAAGPQNTRIVRYDPATGALDLITDRNAEGLAGLTVTTTGEVLALTATRAVELRAPDGTRRTVLPDLPAAYGLDLNAAALAPDGSLYVVLDKDPQRQWLDTVGRHQNYDRRDELVFRLRDGKRECVAGVEVAATTGEATAIALQSPTGVAQLPDGRVLVTDTIAQRVLQIAADGKTITSFAGTGMKGLTGDGGPASAATMEFPACIRTDAAGNAYWLDAHTRIRMVDPAGTISTRYLPTTGSQVQGFDVTPAGTIYMRERRPYKAGQPTNTLRVLDPGQAASRLLSDDKLVDGGESIAATPDGQVFVNCVDDVDLPKLVRWTAAEGVKLVKADLRFYTPNDHGLGVDARGRVYVAGTNADERIEEDEPDAYDAIWRYDPATDAFTTITGPFGTHFKGGSVDATAELVDAVSVTRGGDLLFVEYGLRQIRRIPAAELP